MSPFIWIDGLVLPDSAPRANVLLLRQRAFMRRAGGWQYGIGRKESPIIRLLPGIEPPRTWVDEWGIPADVPPEIPLEFDDMHDPFQAVSDLHFDQASRKARRAGAKRIIPSIELILPPRVNPRWN